VGVQFLIYLLLAVPGRSGQSGRSSDAFCIFLFISLWFLLTCADSGWRHGDHGDHAVLLSWFRISDTWFCVMRSVMNFTDFVRILCRFVVFVTGYLTFGDKTAPNLLTNYPANDPWILASRAMVARSLTYSHSKHRPSIVSCHQPLHATSMISDIFPLHPLHSTSITQYHSNTKELGSPLPSSWLWRPTLTQLSTSQWPIDPIVIREASLCTTFLSCFFWMLLATAIRKTQEIANLTASFPIHSGLDRNSKITCQGSSMFVLVGGAWCSFHGLLEPDMRWAFDLIGIYHWYISLVFIDINVSLGRKGGIREK